jgi:hypothetical protein
MTTTRGGAVSNPVDVAAIVHAAGALYLGLAGRDLRDVLAVGFSLADVAELRHRSRAGLARTIADALRRTGSFAPYTPAAIDRILAIEEEGWDTWQQVVDGVAA